jgi:iron complex outermembrane receptor protein
MTRLALDDSSEGIYMHRIGFRHVRRVAIASTALTALFTFAGQGVALAAETSTDKASTTVGEVMVTAQRRSENLQKVPIAIQVLSSETIRQLGIQSSSDIAQTVPNLQIGLPNGSGNQPIIAIRGIALADYDTNNSGPNGVYLDGVNLSSPAAQTFQIFDLQRIEVLKGPQGTLYGRNASGGAINFISAPPTDTFSTHLHAEYSSFNTVNLEGAVSGPIAQNLDARIAGVYNYSDGFMFNELTGHHENGSSNFAGRFELRWKPTDNFSALLNVNGGRVDNRPAEYRNKGVFVPGSFNPATFGFTFCSQSAAIAGNCVDAFGYGTNKNFYHGAWQRQQHLKINNINASLQLEYSPGPFKLTSITAFEHSDKFHPEDSDAAPLSLVEVDYGVKSDTFTQEVRAAYTGARYDWVVGAYYFHEELSQDQPAYEFLDFDKVFGAHSGDGIAAIVYDTSRQVRNSEAIFGQGDYALTSRLKLTLGGRYTTEHETFSIIESEKVQNNGEGNFGPLTPLWAFSGLNQTNSAFNFRAALNYQITDGVLAYGSVTTGFKSGDFAGGFLSSSPVEAARQLKPVRPESVTDYEVGLKSNWFDQRMLFNLSVFYNDYRNEQVFVILPPIPGGSGLELPVLDNAPRAHTDGVEAEFVVKPFSGLTVSANGAFLEARVDEFTSNRSTTPVDYTGNNLPLAPKFTFSGTVDYRIPVGPGSLDLLFNASYRSMQHFDLTNNAWTSQPAYWLENLRVGYVFDHDRVEVAVFVHNLSNQQYDTFANDNTNPFGFIEDVVGTPRSFGVSLDYHY